MSDKITLLSHRYALEQRIRTLKNSTLNEGKNTSKLLSKMTAMLENVNQQIAELDQADFSNVIQDKETGQLAIVANDDEGSYDSYPDHEVQMARSELYRAAKCAVSLEKMLKQVSEQQGLEGWVQAKITKAADYLESVYHYMDYEMRSPTSEAVEVIRPYGSYKPGQAAGEGIEADAPSPTATPINKPAGPGQASSANPNQPPEPADPGQMSPTPPAGGATPVPTAPGNIKVIRVGPDGQPDSSAPITIPQTDLNNKQRMGYRVAEGAGELKIPTEDGITMQDIRLMAGEGKLTRKTVLQAIDIIRKQRRQQGVAEGMGYRVAEDASAGASSAGSMGGGFGNGFANGGPGSIMRRKPRKKNEFESEEPADPVKKPQPGRWATRKNGQKYWQYEGLSEEESDTKFTGYYKGKDKGKPGKKMVGDA